MQEAVRRMFENGESTEFSGMCVRALAADPQRLTKTGRVLMTGDLGYEYGLQDVDGVFGTLLDHEKPCVVQVVRFHRFECSTACSHCPATHG